MPNLIASADANWKGATMFFSPDWNETMPKNDRIINRFPAPHLFGCLPHSYVPYQFKLAAIQEAREAGFTKIFWIDTSIVMHKNIDKLFEICNEKGVIAFHNLGHRLDKYISDQALYQLGITAQQADAIDQIWGGAIGFNFDNPIACKVFDEIVKFSLDGKTFQESGSIRPDFVSHRHDQAAMSVILNKYNVDLLPYGKIVIRQHSVDPFEYGNDFYLIYG